LQRIRNVQAGLRSRTKILNVLEKTSNQAIFLTKATSLSYSVVLYHLRLLEREEIVKRKGKRPYYWLITGIGQKQLIS
jgi:DNA-binding transcriptional ArsR family regulator